MFSKNANPGTNPHFVSETLTKIGLPENYLDDTEVTTYVDEGIRLLEEGELNNMLVQAVPNFNSLRYISTGEKYKDIFELLEEINENYKKGNADAETTGKNYKENLHEILHNTRDEDIRGILAYELSSMAKIHAGGTIILYGNWDPYNNKITFDHGEQDQLMHEIAHKYFDEHVHYSNRDGVVRRYDIAQFNNNNNDVFIHEKNEAGLKGVLDNIYSKLLHKLFYNDFLIKHNSRSEAFAIAVVDIYNEKIRDENELKNTLKTQLNHHYVFDEELIMRTYNELIKNEPTPQVPLLIKIINGEVV